MQVYCYDDNGFYTGTTTAQKNPREAAFLMPRNSTTEPLPSVTLEAYQAFFFEAGDWSVENVQAKIDDLLATTNDKGSLLYEADEAGLPIARDTGDVTTDDSDFNKSRLKNTAYEEMKEDICTELELLYKTRNAPTATAAAMTWDLMQASPADYSSLGLASEYDLTGIAIGDALDTEAKILDYATRLNAKKLEYSKYRLGRIKQYKDEIIAIG